MPSGEDGVSSRAVKTRLRPDWLVRCIHIIGRGPRQTRQKEKTYNFDCDQDDFVEFHPASGFFTEMTAIPTRLDDQPVADRRLWRIQWVRDLGWIGLTATLLVLAYAVRALILPVLIALALAYMVNPLIVWLKRCCRVPRMAGTMLVMLAGAILVMAMMLAIVPAMVDQAEDLVKQLSENYASSFEKAIQPYIDDVLHRINPTPGSADLDFESSVEVVPINNDPTPATWLKGLEKLDLTAVGQTILQSLDVGVGVVGSAINLAAYLVLASVLIGFSFFFFSWKFDAILLWFDQFIPADQRERTLHIVGRMDRAVSAFIRGRLIQSLVMMIVLSIGWKLAGVPYWLLLGVASGLLNLIPYAAVVGWLTALLLVTVHQLAGVNPDSAGFGVLMLVWPTVVYAIAQLLDGWVVEPLVQGKATELDPLTVMLAVIIGGGLFGLLGLILAIPATACLKILAQELLLPRLRANS